METEIKAETPQIAITDLDVLLQKVLEARVVYEEADALAKSLYHKRKEAEAKFLDKLLAAGKEKWEIPGIGTGSKIEKLSFRVPDGPQNGKALFDYVVSKYGEDVAFGKYFKINSKSLPAFYDQELKGAEDASLFNLPGVEQPTHMVEFRFTKAK